jgi:hypothetical protein
MCGEVLGNKQLVYEEEMKNICDEMGIDNDMISQGLADKEGEFKEKRCKLVNKLCRRICCKQYMITTVDPVTLIKG